MGCMNAKSLASQQPHIVLPGKDLDEEGKEYSNELATTALPTLLTEKEFISQEEDPYRSQSQAQATSTLPDNSTIVRYTSEDPSIDRQRQIVYQSIGNVYHSTNYHYRTFVLPKLLARVLGTKSHPDEEEEEETIVNNNLNQLIATKDTLAAVPINTVYNPAFDEATI